MEMIIAKNVKLRQFFTPEKSLFAENEPVFSLYVPRDMCPLFRINNYVSVTP